MELPPRKKYLDIVREILRRRHYARSTEDSYIGWIKRFIFFHDKRHPREMGAQEVEAFLTHLATELPFLFARENMISGKAAGGHSPSVVPGS